MRILSLILCLTICAGVSVYAGPANTEVVDSPIERMFIPDGFDDNDNSIVILQGTFPNSCYQVGKAEAIISKEDKKITVKAKSLYYPSGPCAQVLVPFMQEVNLGVLEAGVYDVYLDAERGLRRSFQVIPRITDRHDDFMYAPVDSVTVVEKEGASHAVLSGYYPHTFVGCMKFVEFRTRKMPDQDLIVILPITTLTSDNDDPACARNLGGKKFDRIIEINHHFNDVGMIHTRVMNGASVNSIIQE